MVAWFLLWTYASGVTIGAVHIRKVSDIDRMLERLRLHLRDMRGTFFLIEQGMARIAVLADYASVFADVVAVSGDPLANIEALKNATFVMKDGKVFKQPGTTGGAR